MACTPLSITVFVLMGLSGLLLIVGMATDAMYGYTASLFGKITVGLFPPSTAQNILPDWWKTCQAFAIISVLTLAAAVVVSLLTLCCKDLGRRIVLILQAVALFGTAACGLLCIIIFGAEFTKQQPPGSPLSLDYSFALICIGAILALVAGIVCIVDMVKGE